MAAFPSRVVTTHASVEGGDKGVFVCAACLIMAGSILLCSYGGVLEERKGKSPVLFSVLISEDWDESAAKMSCTVQLDLK